MNSEWEARREPWTQSEDDARTPYDVDYARIIHSGSFRRLQGKTQILNLGDSDFYRTRLTHSLEVAQVANGIRMRLEKLCLAEDAKQYLPPASLIQAIGFTHDLGHPPFGHGGEVALNYCMRDHGGFEGNGQTLRILARLEDFSKANGSNLTRRCLLGVLKYPVPYSRLVNPKVTPDLRKDTTAIRIIDREACKPPKCHLDTEADVVDWVLEPFGQADRDRFTSIEEREGKHAKPRYKSFDCTIMDVADDIAYGVHDLEDAIALGLITARDFISHVKPENCACFLESPGMVRDARKQEKPAFDVLVDGLFGPSGRRKQLISRTVGYLINSVVLREDADFEHPLLRFRVELPDGPKAFLQDLRNVVNALVIRSANVQHLEFKGQQMVVAVFEALASEPESFLPADAYADFAAADSDPRAICDYVAGMTDHFLLKTYDRLFSPRMGSVFDKL
ncbi:anti-phage deoxyguanosine triphosphatase [Falsiroseomonas sp. HW251]|uniref:anti-phage deoxyguanosine triphosphatase n=1 Tax=Falsiroseomonas sp. HW251 TaxID=3390998 RepID=UPI003D320FEB